MYCQHCGHKNNPGSKFCEACGKPTAVSAATLPSGGTANKNFRVLALLALIAVAAVAIWILVSQMGGSIGGPSEEDIASAHEDKDTATDITILKKAKCNLPDNERAQGYKEKWAVLYTNDHYRRNYGRTEPIENVLGFDGHTWVFLWGKIVGCPRLE